MTEETTLRGGAPVGYLAELGPVEAGAIFYFRMWCNGPEERAQAQSDFAIALGVQDGRAALQALDDLCTACARHGRRPLVRHQVSCGCVGADESCFANFVAAASEGEHEDAMLIATLIVRPDIAPCIVSMAESLGCALRRMALGAIVAPKNQINHPKTYH